MALHGLKVARIVVRRAKILSRLANPKKQAPSALPGLKKRLAEYEESLKGLDLATALTETRKQAKALLDALPDKAPAKERELVVGNIAECDAALAVLEGGA